MDRGIKHFVRNILGIHLLLLALLLTVVTLAARHVYESARAQALNQARERQTLLATQTARGVSGFYDSILSDLSLMKKPDEDDTDLPDVPQPSTDLRPLTNLGVLRQGSVLLVHQLQGRAHLFFVDDLLHPHALGVDDRPRLADRLMDRPPDRAERSSPNRPPVQAASTTAANSSPQFESEIVAHFSPWLKKLKESDISPMALIDWAGSRSAVKLIAVPVVGSIRQQKDGKPFFLPRRTGWLVAAITARPIERSLLEDPVQKGDLSGAFVVDEFKAVIAGSNHELVGTQLDHATAPELSPMLSKFEHADDGATAEIRTFFNIGAQRFEPALLSAHPIEVMGKRWFLLVASPLKDVDEVVRQLSSRALFWAIFVAVSMTAILVSTATQLILSRLRMERVKHEMLQSEMRQARQIQLNWLPTKTKTLCNAALLDIASLNRPATHISGDFYNFFELPDGRTAVVIGDVTGHGTAAAFLMATTQLLVRNLLPQSMDPGRCLREVNHQLASQVFNGQFVTMQVLVIEPRTGEVMIATAGHPAPLLCDGERCAPVKIEPQLVAGVDPKMDYPTERMRLHPGEALLLYTDGVVETEDAEGKTLRLDGLRKGLIGKIDSAESLLQKAVSTVNTFRRGVDLRDDLTMVALYLLPQPRVAALPQPVAPAPEALTSSIS